jgi:hypothetical protein
MTDSDPDEDPAVTDRFPAPDPPLTPDQILDWLGPAIGDRWITDEEHRAVIAKIGESAFLDIVPAYGFPEDTLARYRIEITGPVTEPEPETVRERT